MAKKSEKPTAYKNLKSGNGTILCNNEMLKIFMDIEGCENYMVLCSFPFVMAMLRDNVFNNKIMQNEAHGDEEYGYWVIPLLTFAQLIFYKEVVTMRECLLLKETLKFLNETIVTKRLMFFEEKGAILPNTIEKREFKKGGKSVDCIVICHHDLMFF